MRLDTTATTPSAGNSGSPAGRPAGITSAPRVVLDSNIWVDLLVFQDPQIEPICAALEAGIIAPVIRADCREELRRVLAYPQFARFDVDIGAALATVDRLANLEAAPPQAACDALRLPRCKDTDDQKFVELAHFAGAACLVSKDKAVLKLRTRLRRSSGVEVMTPPAFGAWLAALAPAAAADPL
ncbi:conserved protein of unknown function [Cupriavidus taiwanensis]|uniref:PIN domain-containing protein n=1 Tax=Cupriavidus taiwanensis TaxID=164546 RepID=A0A375IHP0_9BURK|nr:PIN domain-containing protein [Cupriavidus taiwanensis]SPK72882.1 conserved protein of unknown function [Cupriavidus taiwanensis]